MLLQNITIWVIAVLFMVTGGVSAATEEITVFGPTSSSDWKSVVPLTKKFEEETGIKVNLEGGADAKQALMTAFAGGSTRYDAFLYFPADTDMEDAGYVIPLDGSFDPKLKIPDEIIQDVFPGFVEYLTYKGHFWAWPYSTDTTLLVYRSDLLEEAGFSTPPQTWEELLQFAQKVTADKDGDGIIDIWGYSYFFRPGAGTGESTTSFRQFLWTNGGKYLDEEGKPAFDSKEGIEALQFLLDLRDKYKVSPLNVAQLGEDDVESLFLAGKIASMLGFPKTAGRVTKPDHPLHGKVAVAPHPYKIKPASRLSGGAWYIPKSSQKKELAFQYIQFLTNADSTRFMHKMGLDWSPRMSFFNDPVLRQEVPERAEFLEIYGKALRNAIPEPRFKGKGQADVALSRALDRAATGVDTPEQALKNAAREILRIIRMNR